MTQSSMEKGTETPPKGSVLGQGVFVNLLTKLICPQSPRWSMGSSHSESLSLFLRYEACLSTSGLVTPQGTLMSESATLRIQETTLSELVTSCSPLMHLKTSM